jgi:delta 1-pyrroline-5-carboxylate dehydrogenase
MTHLVRRIALGASIFAAVPLLAQQPMGGPPEPGAGMAGGGPMAGASFLLAHTGDLQLTDQQVTRLAAIARREGAQRKAMRATMDSVRRTMLTQPRDSARRSRRPELAPQMTASMTRAREQMRADLRDAITVLTPDQQAQAWQMISARSAMGRGMHRHRDGMGRHGMGPGGDMGRPGQGPGRGMAPRPPEGVPPQN